MQQTLINVMRASLWVLLPLAMVFAAIMFVTGISFGFTLLNLAKPWPTILWMMVLLFPLAILLTLKMTEGSAFKLAMGFCACWSFVAYYLLYATH